MSLFRTREQITEIWCKNRLKKKIKKKKKKKKKKTWCKNTCLDKNAGSIKKLIRKIEWHRIRMALYASLDRVFQQIPIANMILSFNFATKPIETTLSMTKIKALDDHHSLPLESPKQYLGVLL